MHIDIFITTINCGYKQNK